MCCKACPFAFTDESENIQGLGCLPTPGEVLEMKRSSGHNWACHDSEEGRPKLCAGFAQYVSDSPGLVDINVREGGLISYKDWYEQGPEKAMQIANSSRS